MGRTLRPWPPRVAHMGKAAEVRAEERLLTSLSQSPIRGTSPPSEPRGVTRPRGVRSGVGQTGPHACCQLPETAAQGGGSRPNVAAESLGTAAVMKLASTEATGAVSTAPRSQTIGAGSPK